MQRRASKMPSRRRIAVKNRDEWYYRTRFEQSGEDAWLLEYGRFPSAWQSRWFRGILKTNIIAFLRWCRSRGISLGKIAAWLNEHGPTPTKGVAWHKSTLRYLLDHSPDPREEIAIRRVMRLLKGFRWAERNRQPWLDQIIELSESTEECARRVWEMHKLLLPSFRMLSAHLIRQQRAHERHARLESPTATGMQRRAEFGFRFLGTPSLAAKSLRDIVKDVKSSSNETPSWVAELEQLEGAVPEFLDFQPTKFDVQLLGKHKTTEALLRILCRLERISARSARRYKYQSVQ